MGFFFVARPCCIMSLIAHHRGIFVTCRGALRLGFFFSNNSVLNRR